MIVPNRNPAPQRAALPQQPAPQRVALLPPPAACASGIFYSLLLLALAFFLLTSCAKDDDAIVRLSSEQLEQSFASASESLRRENYKQAINSLSLIAHDHPYSALAPRAQLLLAYAYYKKGRKTEALVEAETFILAYPASPSLAYALYLKGLIYFQNIRHIERSQEDMVKARGAFEMLERRFPASAYAHDAKDKLNLIATQLVGHEIQNARFYLKHRRAMSAAEQLIIVLSNYPNTLYTPEILYRLVEASLSLGLVEEALLWHDFLALNFPDSKWRLKGDKRLAKSKASERIKVLIKIPDTGASPAALPPKRER